MASNVVKDKERTVGNYIIGKTIGEGTFGKVKLGVHQPSGEKVAIKILEKDKIQEQADVERVAKEIQILKMLRHQNIIQLYEIIETPKELFLIMEYANGGELFDYIVTNTRVKEKEACKSFQQIIAGVEYIHKIGVVHRDLKPENLLFDNQQNIKIVDFGLSNTYKNNETLKTACGSPCYAAPEMIAGKRYLGLQVDIWSCGVIMFALICGYLPFEDPNTSQLYKKIIAGDFQIPKFVTAEAKDLLKCILNTDPTKRYTIKDIRAHVWYKQVTQNLEDSKGIIVGVDPIRPDEFILDQLKQQFNIDQTQSRKMVSNNRHNNITTLYYLIQQRNKQIGRNKSYSTPSTRVDENIDFNQGHSIGQAEQGLQIHQKYNQVSIPSEESPINITAGVLKINFTKNQKEKDKSLEQILENSPKQTQPLQREIIIKPKIHMPPMKLQFNPITQAVNNSISSVGTNTTTTPLATARKLKEETSVDDKKLRVQPFTDRVEMPFEIVNNSLLEMNDRYIKNDINDKTKSENSPKVHNIKSLSQHSEPNVIYSKNDFNKRYNKQQDTKVSFKQGSQTPTYSSTLNQINQPKNINMSYFVQSKVTHPHDSILDQILHQSNKGSNTLKSPTSTSNRSKQITSQQKLLNRSSQQPQSNSAYKSSQKNNQQDQMRVHKGPFNLQCISTKQPQQLMEDLLKATQQFKLQYEYKSNYELYCTNKELTKFEIGISILNKCDGIYYVKGKFIQGDTSIFQMFSHNILQTINL